MSWGEALGYTKLLPEKPKGFSSIEEISKELGVSTNRASLLLRKAFATGTIERVEYKAGRFGGGYARGYAYRVKKK